MNIPKSWSEVTIKQFLDTYSISTSKVITDPLERSLHTISAMAGITYKEVEALPITKIHEYNAQLSFLSELPSERLPLSFTLDGTKYKAMIFHNEMTAAQFIDYCSVCKATGEDLIYSMHKLLACFCVPRTRRLPAEYKYDGYTEQAEIFYNKMPVSMAYPFYVFFCKVAENLLPVMEDYFRNKTLKNLKEAKKILNQVSMN